MPPLPTEHPTYKPPTPRLIYHRVARRRKKFAREAPMVSHFDPLKYVRVREAAMLLGVKERTVRGYIQRGVLQHVRLFGRYVLIPIEDVRKLQADRQEKLRAELVAVMASLSSAGDLECSLEAVRSALSKAKGAAKYNKFFENQVPKSS